MTPRSPRRTNTDGPLPVRFVPGQSPQIPGAQQLVLHPSRPPATGRAVLLTRRDLALLAALDAYRYLDTQQLARLFFAGEHRTWTRLRELAALGLTSCWLARVHPGRAQRPAVHLLTPAGARELAREFGRDPRPAVTRARHARTRTQQLVHDLGANGFFSGLALASRTRADQGLYHWLGQAACRDVGRRTGTPPADGWGRYLLPDREIHFFLEWDRGTEHPHRLEATASRYLRYFDGRVEAERRHVLFVVPTAEREGEVQRVLGSLVRRVDQCRFATATTDHVAAASTLGPIWEVVGSQDRVSFDLMPGVQRSTRRADDSIGKPDWWERRPAGGEGP